MNQTLGPLDRLQFPVTQIAAGLTGDGYVTLGLRLQVVAAPPDSPLGLC